jgi:hypothetical protein
LDWVWFWLGGGGCEKVPVPAYISVTYNEWTKKTKVPIARARPAGTGKRERKKTNFRNWVCMINSRVTSPPPRPPAVVRLVHIQHLTRWGG